jgi:hypothetical protein
VRDARAHGGHVGDDAGAGGAQAHRRGV